MAQLRDIESVCFEAVVTYVKRLLPGECVTFDKFLYLPQHGGTLGEFVSNGFTPADNVLEQVVGSGYTHRYIHSLNGRDIMFLRLHCELPEGVRSYVSPDRRDRFRKRTDELYELPDFVTSAHHESRIQCALQGHQFTDVMTLVNVPFTIYSADEAWATTPVKVVSSGKQYCKHCNFGRDT